MSKRKNISDNFYNNPIPIKKRKTNNEKKYFVNNCNKIDFYFTKKGYIDNRTESDDVYQYPFLPSEIIKEIFKYATESIKKSASELLTDQKNISSGSSQEAIASNLITILRKKKKIYTIDPCLEDIFTLSKYSWKVFNSDILPFYRNISYKFRHYILSYSLVNKYWMNKIMNDYDLWYSMFRLTTRRKIDHFSNITTVKFMKFLSKNKKLCKSKKICLRRRDRYNNDIDVFYHDKDIEEKKEKNQTSMK